MLLAFLALLCLAIAGVTYALIRVTPAHVLAQSSPRYWRALHAAADKFQRHRQAVVIVLALGLGGALVYWLYSTYFAQLVVAIALVGLLAAFFYRNKTTA